MSSYKLFVTGHKGFETLLFRELRDLLEGSGAALDKRYGGVAIDAGLDTVYRICLHSRLANRVFCELAKAKVENEADLYQAIAAIDWSEQMDVDSTLSVSATLSRARLTHNHFAALRVKDAIVDHFRERCGERPSVARQQADIQVHVNIHQSQATISLDLSGDSLHRRGYRLQHSGAPLKEHLAAALLYQAGWDGAPGSPRLLDPMCGSGTFVIEAAMMAARIAPGGARQYFGFLGWKGHQPEMWQAQLEQSMAQRIERPEVEIFAADYDATALDIARANARRAGVEELIRFSHQQVCDLELPAAPAGTLVICNPPYEKRLQSEHGLGLLYAELGAMLQRVAPAQLAVISANPDLLHRLQLKREQRKPVRNGPIDCVFAQFSTTNAEPAVQATAMIEPLDDPVATPLRNRLLKNQRHLQRWARRNHIGCYRVYDADLPEFAFALDCYQSDVAAGQQWFHLQEYQAPASIDAGLAAERIALAQRVVAEVFQVASGDLFCKTRSRQRGDKQYGKQDNRGEFFQVREGAAALLVNLSDYLDSGLFLDHRETRQRVYRAAQGKRVLNLFCYTAAVGVQAALGGADSVVNVDLSANYLKWARENFLLNGLDDEQRYRLLRADIVELLHNPRRHGLAADFDIIFLDPPSFSNSSRMAQTLDVQRDHVELISRAMALLKDDGLLIFSTNRRGFRLSPQIAADFDVTDITQATVCEDFKRNPRIHQCWEIRYGSGRR